MKKYYIRDFDNKENYLKFIHYLMSNSDTFSLVYFRYQENSKPTRTTKQVSKMLDPYKIYAERVYEWPSMITWDTVHIYKLTMYRACEEAEEALALADCLYDWDYSKYPMDLCFYKDGYCWFATSSHECWNALYTNSKKTKIELEKLGVIIDDECDFDESNLFYNEKAIIKGTNNKL